MNAFCFVGLDIGRYNIAVCIIDEAENKLDSFTITQTHQGYQQLIDKLLQLKSDGLIPIVSSEGHDGNLAPLDEYLLDEAILFKPLHPTAVNRYKDVLGAPHKTDDYDAYVIADLLRVQHGKIPAHQHQKESAEFKNLSRTYKAFSKTKTQFSNQLRCELMSYFPELVTDSICSTITSKTFLQLLVEYPTPEHIRNSSVEELTVFIAKHSKNRLGRQTAEKLMRVAESVHRYPSHLDSKALVVQTLARQILTLAQNLSELKKQLTTLAEGIVRDSTYRINSRSFCDYRHPSAGRSMQHEAISNRGKTGYVLWRCPCLRRLRQAKGIPQNHSIAPIKWLKMLSCR